MTVEQQFIPALVIASTGLGILGTFMILFGVSIYIARKRYNFLAKYIRLKYLLEFHIFLCTFGPILVVFHTTFKFNGIVSIAFWSMVAVVLKSYWLTIHVSLEAGSYGFLMLGAIIGLMNLTLMIFLNESNKNNIKRIIQEMSYISEMTLIGGLFMLSIGTYLGCVWANESWGRYWGWDAKETWALVSILVYAFILHMRLIPKLNGLFSYNVATIFGLGSVVMTYYGVNYYLSGLHYYATGDPVPIPNWVYIFVVYIIILSTLAYLKKRKFKIIS